MISFFSSAVSTSDDSALLIMRLHLRSLVDWLVPRSVEVLNPVSVVQVSIPLPTWSAFTELGVLDSQAMAVPLPAHRPFRTDW